MAYAEGSVAELGPNGDEASLEPGQSELGPVGARAGGCWGRLEPCRSWARQRWGQSELGPVGNETGRSRGRSELGPVGARVGRSWGQLEPGPVGAGAAV